MNYFFMNGKKCGTHMKALTGAEIKQLGNVPEGYHLHYENPDNTGYPWVYIGDGEAVTLDKGIIHFFANPTTTM